MYPRWRESFAADFWRTSRAAEDRATRMECIAALNWASDDLEVESMAWRAEPEEFVISG